LFFTQEKKMIM